MKKIEISAIESAQRFVGIEKVPGSAAIRRFLPF
jgi:hypothetical protein